MQVGSSEPCPAMRARDSLVKYIDLIKADSGELVSQLKQDSTCELEIDWDDIKKKIIGRKYTIYASLNGDIQKILDHVLAASKRNTKQRGSGTTHKSIKRHLDKYERYLRGHLYDWHPKGKEQAAKEEKAHREKQWAGLEHTAAAELHTQMSAQLRNLTMTQQRTRDSNINEVAARVLETSQQLKSTHGFGEDPLAVHTWLRDCAPRLAPHTTEDLIGSDDEHACMASSAVADVEGVTAVVRRLRTPTLDAERLADGEAVPSGGAEPQQLPRRQRQAPSEAGASAMQDSAAASGLRAAEWKGRWIQLRIADLSFLERHLEATIAAKTERERREVQAAQDSPWIAGQAPRRPLPQAAPVTAPGFTADALRAHPFFRECEAAVASGDASLLLPPPADAVQPMTSEASTPAAVHWALVGLQSNASALAHYISTETGQVVKAATTAAPSKVPKKAMPRQRSTASMGGIALARRNSERKPGSRRESVLPEEMVEELLRRPPKPFMRPPRELTAEDIAARIAEESSGEDEPTSDSYYLHLHDLEQAKKEHAEREAGAREKERERRSQRPMTPGGRARSQGTTPLPAVSGGAVASTPATDGLARTHSAKGPVFASSPPEPHDPARRPAGAEATSRIAAGSHPPAASAAAAVTPPLAATQASPNAAGSARVAGQQAPQRGPPHHADRLAQRKRSASVDAQEAPPAKRAQSGGAPADGKDGASGAL